VSSYLAFSPLPRTRHGGYFLLHFYALADIFQLGSMVPCAARTFLTGIARRGRTVFYLLFPYIKKLLYFILYTNFLAIGLPALHD